MTEVWVVFFPFFFFLKKKDPKSVLNDEEIGVTYRPKPREKTKKVHINVRKHDKDHK